MIFKKFIIGQLENNCFIIGDEKSKECLIIDPGDEPDRILDFIRKNHFEIKYIICTHGHFDHIGAVSEIKKETGGSVVIHREDLELYMRTKDQAALWGFELDPQPAPDAFVSEGDTIAIGDLKFEVLYTPGHSPGGICLYGEGILITGDTLFAGSVGRTDFPGGDLQALKKSFKRLMSLPDDVRVLPGHGPESTIGKEKTNNFFSYEYDK
jgi:glyoxylase-like metal-dependent hydrolase (beta-lactamase superfamily II)